MAAGTKTRLPTAITINPTLMPFLNPVFFRIQVAISSTDIGTNAKKFAPLTDVRIYRHQGMYKYTSGNEKKLEDALLLLEEIKKKGFKDAFVIAFRGEERITVQQAVDILETGKRK